MKNNYKGFTLVEMLVVMGILMILMAVGIASGRYAIQRANDIAHQDAADELWDALVGFYTDKRIYPEKEADCTGASVASGNKTLSIAPSKLIELCLTNYLDGAFDGGSSTSFYYMVAENRQSAIVCVSKGGVDDEAGRGFYCTGNGFRDTALAGGKFIDSNLDSDQSQEPTSLLVDGHTALKSDWNGSEWASNQ
ncbi:prepilin-type N-terminal cleavage/methylation domain-containing protein [bacterium]|nr:prepilin-type N-terminal cleavage/methylation domain-containing protein [bacterium]